MKPMSRHKQEEVYFPEQIQNATHVYVKLDKSTPLSPRYAGPYPIVSRPSRTTVTVKEGTYVSGIPKLSTYHWETVKIAHMREGQKDAERPKRGRPSKSTPHPQLTPSPKKH